MRGALRSALVPRGPDSPFGAKVETCEAADGVGLLRLHSGESIRFGRSSCKGFDPLADARVTVAEVAPHPRGGLRAKTVPIDPKDTEYDRLLETIGTRRTLPRETHDERSDIATCPSWTRRRVCERGQAVRARRRWAFVRTAATSCARCASEDAGDVGAIDPTRSLAGIACCPASLRIPGPLRSATAIAPASSARTFASATSRPVPARRWLSRVACRRERNELAFTRGVRELRSSEPDCSGHTRVH